MNGDINNDMEVRRTESQLAVEAVNIVLNEVMASDIVGFVLCIVATDGTTCGVVTHSAFKGTRVFAARREVIRCAREALDREKP